MISARIGRKDQTDHTRHERLETFGDTASDWLRVTINTLTPGLLLAAAYGARSVTLSEIDGRSTGG